MTRAFLLFVALLAGCSPEVRDIALADIDLRDMNAVAKIRSQLDSQDSVAFANYVVRHHRAAASFCGQPLVGAGGKEPVTIGEAVDLSIERANAERLALLEAQKPKHPSQIAKEEWDNLIRTRDILLDSQTRVQMEYGKSAVRRPEWKSIETKMAEIDKKLVAMKPIVFGSENF